MLTVGKLTLYVGLDFGLSVIKAVPITSASADIITDGRMDQTISEALLKVKVAVKNINILPLVKEINLFDLNIFLLQY